jgi:2Fe-2S ferredoxin
MARITYLTFDGREHEVEVANGHTVKDGAIDNMIPGIDAECGGACACATCHVYVDPSWAAVVGPAGAMEADMLEYLDTRADGSRLSCQIVVTDALSGLIVHMPSRQC